MRFDRCKVGETLFFYCFFPNASPMLGFSFSFLRREGSETEEPDEQGRNEGRKEGRGKKTGRKGGRKEGRKEERKEGRHERGRSGKRGNSLEIASGDLRWRERDGSAGPAWMDCEA